MIKQTRWAVVAVTLAIAVFSTIDGAPMSDTESAIWAGLFLGCLAAFYATCADGGNQ